MKANRRFIIISILMAAIFSISFSIGIFSNPNFDIHDFFMGLSTEILGTAIALIVVETYIREKQKHTLAQEKAPHKKEQP